MKAADHDMPLAPRDPELDVIRGRAARRLREDHDLGRILEARETEIYRRWLGADTTTAREACWYEMRAVEALRDAIRAEEDAGKIAADEIRRLNAGR